MSNWSIAALELQTHCGVWTTFAASLFLRPRRGARISVVTHCREKKKFKKDKKECVVRLGYRESNPGLLREQSLLRSESQRCYRYTIPD